MTSLEAQPRVDSLGADSLRMTWEDPQQDPTLRLQAVDRLLADGYFQRNPDSALAVAKTYHALAQGLGDSVWMQKALKAQGTAFQQQGLPDSAAPYLERAIALLTGRDQLIEKVNILLLLGGLYTDQGEWGQAAKTLFQALAMVRDTDDQALRANTLMRIGVLYQSQHELEQAITYFGRSLAIFDRLEDPGQMAKNLNNIAIIYFMQGKSNQGLDYFRQSLAVHEEAGDTLNMIIGHQNIGGLYAHLKQFDQGLAHLEQGLALAQQIGQEQELGGILRNISAVYEMKQAYPQAIRYGQQALRIGQATGELPLVEEISRSLYALYKRNGQHQAALDMYEIYVQARDSIRSEKNEKETLRQQLQDDFRQQTLVDSLANVQQQAAVEMAYQWQLSRRNYLLVGAVALALIVLLFVSYHQQVRSSQKELELQHERQQQVRLQEVHALKTQFFTNVSHEFRTPLTVILGMAEQLPANGEQARRLISRNGRRLLRLINQLLDLSQLEHHERALSLVRGEAVAYLRSVAESLAVLAHQRQITLRVAAIEDKIEMDYDPDTLQEITYNLLANAVKYTQEGGEVVLEIGQEGTAPTLRLRCTVRDNGPGIPPEELPHVFDRFYQGSQAAQIGSSGIGLALVKAMVIRMGGQVEVQSTLGQGTAFTFWLPLRREATTPPAVGAQGRSTLAALPADSDDLTPENPDQPQVLIIEDHFDMISYLSAILEPSYRLLTATDGDSGLALAQEHIPDLVVCDVMMPGKDGFAVTQALKTDPRSSHIPVILLTAKATQADKLSGLAHGADAYLSKPFDQAELLLRIDKLLALRQQLQAWYQQRALTAPSAEAKLPSTDPPSLDEQFIDQIQGVIQARLSDPTLNVYGLGEAVHLGRTQVYRKLKALTGHTPTLYIRSARLKRAKELLRSTTLQVAEVAYDVGFNDPGYFSRAFTEEFGTSPSEWSKSDHP
jgi:signal transduction histidine kinase/DNA-binding response OmpR family regulator